MTSVSILDSRAVIETSGISVGYDGHRVCRDVSIEVPPQSFTAIIGPNACGKSTLLKAIARLLPIGSGSVLLSGRDISRIRTKEIAKQLGLLPQSSLSPDGITVADLVGRGRYPHQGMFDRWSKDDEAAVAEALSATRLEPIADRQVDELSGGQRQRVWLAMVLAQQTPVMLLDEPTTFLDIAHQYSLLELFDELRVEHGRTIVVVLHDLNQAARYADHLIVMKDGEVVAAGAPAEVISAELVESVYGLRCRVQPDPETGAPMIIPKAGRSVVV